jgi:hypothetical protein
MFNRLFHPCRPSQWGRRYFFRRFGSTNAVQSTPSASASAWRLDQTGSRVPASKRAPRKCGSTPPPPPATDADTLLARTEAEARAAEFSALLGREVTAEDVLSADADWLQRYGRTVDDLAADYGAGECRCGTGK